LEFVAAVLTTGWRHCELCVASDNIELCRRSSRQGLTCKDGRIGYFREVRG
jgi:hypothetical protein